MTPEIQQQLVDWLINIGNITADELPIFVHEIAMYGFLKGIILSIILFATIIFLICTIKYFIKQFDYNGIKITDSYDEKQRKEDKQFLCIAFTILSVIILIPSVIFLPINLSTAIKAYAAPKLYAIDYFRKR